MCKRHVQEIREHEGEIRKCARDTAGDQYEGEKEHIQQTMCRRSGNMKER